MRHTLESTLSRQLHWIGAADAKIPPILAVDTAMLGVITAFAPAGGDWTLVTAFFAAATLLALGTSFVHLFLAAFPRTSGPSGSMVFFGGIVEHGEEAFVQAITNLDSPRYTTDLARQCYRNAEIAAQKFGHIKTATKLMFVGLIPWVIGLYLMYPNTQ